MLLSITFEMLVILGLLVFILGLIAGIRLKG